MNNYCDVINGDCLGYLNSYDSSPFDLAFLDPPFNQSKEYQSHDDNMIPEQYWKWMYEVCSKIYQKSVAGGAIYFMQREKNAKYVLEILQESGWTYQNLIVWKKKTSAVPSNMRYGKHYQIIVFATKGKKPRVFNKLRYDPPLLVTEKYKRPNGVFVTDVWDDIRELTSGYLAGDEPLREKNGERAHKQQSPIHLITRIILSSTMPNDLILDPFAGTGTTLVVAKQLHRNSIGIELDKKNSALINNRISNLRKSDDISKLYDYYKLTSALDSFWGIQPK